MSWINDIIQSWKTFFSFSFVHNLKCYSRGTQYLSSSLRHFDFVIFMNVFMSLNIKEMQRIVDEASGVCPLAAGARYCKSKGSKWLPNIWDQTMHERVHAEAGAFSYITWSSSAEGVLSARRPVFSCSSIQNIWKKFKATRKTIIWALTIFPEFWWVFLGKKMLFLRLLKVIIQRLKTEFSGKIQTLILLCNDRLWYPMRTYNTNTKNIFYEGL